ncbi:MAG TPA: MurR/RpiR family transcriptional regulator [Firmicutes bacterium]|nr:MurR/RpiR family transcriptional regulator [Bacillota bacterium]
MAEKTVLESIEISYSEMFSAERKVAKAILQHPEKAIMMNVSELAQLSGVSDATVIRMCKRIGYQGYSQMKILLANDLGKDEFNNLKSGGKQPETVRELFQLFASNILHVAGNLQEDVLAACLELILNAATVYLAAAGNTAPLANDFGFRLERFGIRASYSMVSDYYLNHIGLAGEGDLLIAISHSGASKQVMHAMELAKDRGLKSIAITDFANSPVSNLADHLLLSKVKNPIFSTYDPDSHLGIVVIIDALLYLIKNAATVEGNDRIELMLSEYKL